MSGTHQRVVAAQIAEANFFQSLAARKCHPKVCLCTFPTRSLRHRTPLPVTYFIAACIANGGSGVVQVVALLVPPW